MLDSPLLEAAIGLALIFLLLSLLVSAVNELVLGHLAQWRSHVLREGLQSLLTGTRPTGSTTRRILAAIGSTLARKFRGPGSTDTPGASGGDSIAQALFNSPLIRGLGGSADGFPGYLPAETFADAYLALLKSKGLLDPSNPAPTDPPSTDSFTRDLVRALLADTPTLAARRERLVHWFNQSMEIVSGTYRRHTQFCMHIWAAVLVGLLNIDAIGLSQRLMADKSLRKALVTWADNRAARPAATNLSQETIGEIRTNLEQLRIPLGWGPGSKASAKEPLPPGIPAGARPLPMPEGWEWLLKALGLLLSIAAVSQGAPFWFDVLNRLTNLRAATKPAPPKPAATP